MYLKYVMTTVNNMPVTIFVGLPINMKSSMISHVSTFHSFCRFTDKQEVIHDFTCLDVPQLHGVVKRKKLSLT